jgi:hypothetical protein
MAVGRAERALGSRGVLYQAQKEGARPAQQGAAWWVATWQARQGSGNMLATVLAKKTLLDLMCGGPTAAIAVV